MHTWCHPVFNEASNQLKFHSIFINTLGRAGGGFSPVRIGTGRVIKDKLICNPRSLIRRVEVNRGTDSPVSPVATCLYRDIIILRRVSVPHHHHHHPPSILCASAARPFHQPWKERPLDVSTWIIHQLRLRIEPAVSSLPPLYLPPSSLFHPVSRMYSLTGKTASG